MAGSQARDHAPRPEPELPCGRLPANSQILPRRSGRISSNPCRLWSRSGPPAFAISCVPGTMPEKAAAFDHISALLAPSARLFGATIVQGSLPRSGLAQAFMDLYNRKGLFSNAGDTIEDLDAALRQRFRDVRLESRGTVVLFEARAHDRS